MKQHNLKPVGRFAVVKMDLVQEETSDVGIIMHSGNEEKAMYQEAHTYGVIQSLGEGCGTCDTWGNEQVSPWKVGDHIYFKTYAGPIHRSKQTASGKPCGDYLMTMKDVDMLGHVDTVEVKDE